MADPTETAAVVIARKYGYTLDTQPREDWKDQADPGESVWYRKTASAVLASLAQHRDEMARLMRTLDANSPEDRERLGRWWDERSTSPDVVEKAYARVDAVLAYLTGDEQLGSTDD